MAFVMWQHQTSSAEVVKPATVIIVEVPLQLVVIGSLRLPVVATGVPPVVTVVGTCIVTRLEVGLLVSKPVVQLIIIGRFMVKCSIVMHSNFDSKLSQVGLVIVAIEALIIIGEQFGLIRVELVFPISSLECSKKVLAFPLILNYKNDYENKLTCLLDR